jgi:hypothetical protein
METAISGSISMPDAAWQAQIEGDTEINPLLTDHGRVL